MLTVETESLYIEQVLVNRHDRDEELVKPTIITDTTKSVLSGQNVFIATYVKTIEQY